jgi:hypothetical protein
MIVFADDIWYKIWDVVGFTQNPTGMTNGSRLRIAKFTSTSPVVPTSGSTRSTCTRLAKLMLMHGLGVLWDLENSVNDVNQ